MVPTEDAMITRQMLYSAFRVPNTCAFAIVSSNYLRQLVSTSSHSRRKAIAPSLCGVHCNLDWRLHNVFLSELDGLQPGSTLDPP
jgi:hypothetical protein